MLLLSDDNDFYEVFFLTAKALVSVLLSLEAKFPQSP
jgi:hypothetical protein